jgi:parallel beta-helix repeat protein
LHSNISIGSDAGFTPANGVVGGLGTVSQPYIIEGWETTSISISGTTAYFIIRNVYVHDGFGITLQTRNGQIGNSTVKNNSGSDGIDIFSSTNIIVDRNNVSFNGGGIGIGGSDLVTVSANNVLNNRPSNFPVNGITISTSTRVTVRGNHLTSNDIVPTGSPFQLSSLIITSDNTVDGKPVNYYYGCSGTTVNMGPPQDLIFAACTNIHVTSTALSGTGFGFGIQLISVNGAVLSGDTFANNMEGIRVYNSTGFTISNNNLSASNKVIDARYSSNITIQGNNITSGDTGIFAEYSSKVTVSNNRLAGGINGIEVLWSNTTTITNNFVTGVSQTAIWAEGNGLATNITDNSALNNGIGISFCGCNIRFIVSGTISRNVIQNNGDGIDVTAGNCYFCSPRDFNVTANNVSDNNIGMTLDYPFFVSFYHNNFISNAHQVSGVGYQTVPWDNGYPSGGNYWSDFPGKDNCSGPRQDICPSPDGIADTPYRITGTAVLDNYPLMKPFGPADTVQPSWPTNSRILTSNITQTSVALTWTAATDDTGIFNYRLYNGNNLIGTVPGAFHSFLVSNLTQGTVYTFKVEAVDAWGNISNADPSTTVRTSSVGTGVTSWQQYWPLIIGAGVAGVGVTSMTLLWRRRKTRNRGRATQGTVQLTSSNVILP